MTLGGRPAGKRRRSNGGAVHRAGIAPTAPAVRQPVAKTYRGRLPVSGTPAALERARQDARKRA